MWGESNSNKGSNTSNAQSWSSVSMVAKTYPQAQQQFGGLRLSALLTQQPNQIFDGTKGSGMTVPIQRLATK
eukprot:CAMPEP_0172461814 /NCGR_PEP_ID=MMETSP1065-20121228/41819_1 /TAXON_ID=265537 /ORGANISM="Amphiprora paludosa, Strain CCMP125" /LENGTH=71 /DNA_ID=CAMNT_0013217269 /DNA_START=128 /DNA_END=341 /DNA_ORIENTATION=+